MAEHRAKAEAAARGQNGVGGGGAAVGSNTFGAALTACQSSDVPLWSVVWPALTEFSRSFDLFDL